MYRVIVILIILLSNVTCEVLETVKFIESQPGCMALYKSKSTTVEYNDKIMTKGKRVTELGVVLRNFVDDF